MSPRYTRRALILVALAMNVLLAGCATRRCKSPPQQGTTSCLVSIGYSTGGFGPLVGIVHIQTDGILRFRSLKQIEYCSQLSSREYQEIRGAFNSVRFQQEAMEIERRRYWESCYECEAIGIYYGEQKVFIPVEDVEVPVAVEQFLRLVDEICAEKFGSRYKLPLTTRSRKKS